MIRLACLWPVTIIVSSLTVGYMMFGDISSPLRPLMAFWFLIICPGMALVRLLRISDLMIELTLAVALSFALDAILASVMVYAGAWSPAWGLAMLLVVSLGGATVQLFRDCRPSVVSGQWSVPSRRQTTDH